MTIDVEQSAIRAVIAAVLAEQGEGRGRGLDALAAMRQADAIVKALEHADYEIRRRR
jgi:ribosome-interacting GTPase 1